MLDKHHKHHHHHHHHHHIFFIMKLTYVTYYTQKDTVEEDDFCLDPGSNGTFMIVDNVWQADSSIFVI